MIKSDNYSSSLIGFALYKDNKDSKQIPLPKSNMGKFLRAFGSLICELCKKQPKKNSVTILQTV